MAYCVNLSGEGPCCHYLTMKVMPQ